MGTELIKKLIITLVIIFASSGHLYPLSENGYISSIKKLHNQDQNDGNSKKMKDLTGSFFKEYPNSKYIADIRFILAESETDPKKAVTMYKLLINNYRYFKNRCH